MTRGIGATVWDLVQRWTPSEVYGHEDKYQSELQDVLNRALNESSARMGTGAGSGDHVVSTERGTGNGDVVVDDAVGIELKRNFTSSQKRNLRGQLEDYAESYDWVIACACGIEDGDGWRELQQEYQSSQQGMMMTEFRFIIKRRETFGDDSAEPRPHDTREPTNASGSLTGESGNPADDVFDPEKDTF